MANAALISLCWIALLLSAVGYLAVSFIGATYFPETALRNLVVFGLSFVFVGTLLIVSHRVAGAHRSLWAATTGVTGLGLSGVFGYMLFVGLGDPDVLVCVPPFILGLGLLALAATGGLRCDARGDV